MIFIDQDGSLIKILINSVLRIKNLNIIPTDMYIVWLVIQGYTETVKKRCWYMHFNSSVLIN